MLKIGLCFLALFLSLPAPAYAYIDPGTSSMLLQILAAGAAGVAIFWRHLKAMFTGLFKKKRDERGDEPQ